jgi:hypothetical protein
MPGGGKIHCVLWSVLRVVDDAIVVIVILRGLLQTEDEWVLVRNDDRGVDGEIDDVDPPRGVELSETLEIWA